MKYTIQGPTIACTNDQFGDYLFNHISNQDQSKIITINSETAETITTERLHSCIIRTACALKPYVKQEDVIGLICENEISTIFPLMASMYLGTTVSLVNPSYNYRELRNNFNQSRPKVIFCSKRSTNDVLEIKKQVDFIELVIVLSEKIEDNRISTIYDFMESADISDVNFRPAALKDENQTALILSSSGTSGPPKGVMLTYKNLRCSIPFMTGNQFADISCDAVFLVLVPIYHMLGCFMIVFGIARSTQLVLMKKFVPNAFLQTLQDYKVTKMLIVPQLATFMAKHPSVDKYDLSSVEDIVCGAAPIPQNVLDLLQTRLNTSVRQAYGLTEATAVAFSPFKGAKPDSCGLPCPNLTLKIRDVDTGKQLPANSAGEICLKGPTVMKGYVNNPKASEDSIDDDGYLLTGDVGYFDNDGFIYIIDRLKDMIKCKGFQVAPSELEEILGTHAAVKEVAVIGIPHERAGEVPLAFVVKQLGAEISETELISYVDEHVSQNKRLIGGVKFIEEMPRNSNGKLLKRLLRELMIKK